jgi:hypothetical protein
MFKPNKTLVGLAASATILLSGGLAIALDAVETEPVDQHLVRACERDVQNRSPQGWRNIRFRGYEQESPGVGLVTGSFKTQTQTNRWEQVGWTCRIHPKSRRVLRTEFSWTSGGGRLMAAAAYLR